MIIPIVKYSSANLPKYDYTGQAPLFFKDNQGNWEMVFTGNCTVTFSRLITNVDIFAVGGGMPATGSEGYAANNYAKGGSGGKGGGCVTSLNKALNAGTEYRVTIGGSSLSTSAFGVTAPAGGGSNGGAGAVTPSSAAGNGTDGVLAFGRTTASALTLYEDSLGDSAIYFGGGGGGGAAKGSWSGSLLAAGTGGASGGGAGGSGGSDETQEARNGRPNTGGGGGGGSRNNTTGSEGNFPGPGLGGSGIVIIRNARASE